MIAFPWVRTIYIHIYLFIFLCPLTQVCIVYVVKEVASFPGGLGQLMGVAHNRTHARTSQKESCL